MRISLTRAARAACAACAAGMALYASGVQAQTQPTQELDAEPSQVNREQPIAVPDPKPVTAAAAPASAEKLTFGGAIRARYDWRFNDVSLGGQPKASEHLDFDTLSLKVAYDSPTIFGAAQYRFYGGSSIYGPRNGYSGHPGEVSFPMWAYLGYKLTPDDSITVGMNQVPFGLTPYFGTSFIETLGFTMGLEEVYNLGVKYAHVEPDLNYQFGFYPGANPNAIGASRDSARYSTNIVFADSYTPFATRNAEENMFVGRAEYFVVKNEAASLAFGASIWHSDIHNYDTRQTGTKQLEGVHMLATYGAWGFKGIFIRQDIDPKNPVRNDLIGIGGFDFSYNMATHGNFVSGEVTYKVADPIGPFTVVPYFGYSAYYKDKASFRDSERFILGGAWTLTADPNLVIYTEGVFGRNDPYVGAGQFAGGLAQGGDNRWKTRFIMNIGYYF
jgi:hypothetical protein